MTTQLEAAARQALEALEKCDSALAEELAAWDIDPPLQHVLDASNACDPAITALRSALEQQAAQEETSDCALNLCDPSGPHEAGCYLVKQRVAQEPVSSSQSTAADSYLSALLRYTASFYASAIEHGMKRGATADAVAHVERAARGLHRLATHPAPPHAAQESIKEHDQSDVRCECCGYMTYHREHLGCIKAAPQQAAQERQPDTRPKVKIGSQYGKGLAGHWFYLHPADEYAEQALTAHTGIKGGE